MSDSQDVVHWTDVLSAVVDCRAGGSNDSETRRSMDSCLSIWYDEFSSFNEGEDNADYLVRGSVEILYQDPSTLLHSGSKNTWLPDE